MPTRAKTLLMPEQYLEIERKAECKSEYYQGEMSAMAGASWVHNRIVADVIIETAQQLRSGPSGICPSDLRVRVTATGLYTYPDGMVVCDKPQFLDQHFDTRLNPTVSVEVLSPSAEAYDRGRMFEHYQSIDSLNEYLLVSSERVQVDHYARQPGGQWLLTPTTRPEDVIDLESAGCRIPVASLYEKGELP
jgi:Uma2 family endonuclease